MNDNRKLYEAVFAAREAALALIKPDARAADVDLRPRKVITITAWANTSNTERVMASGFRP